MSYGFLTFFATRPHTFGICNNNSTHRILKPEGGNIKYITEVYHTSKNGFLCQHYGAVLRLKLTCPGSSDMTPPMPW
eukprot:272823-Amphidinium_carterae.1